MTTIKSSTTLTTAYQVVADTTGALVIQTGATPTTALTISSAQVVTLAQVLPEASGGTGTTTGYYGFKNRIINGAMVIDQRNAGASVNTAGSFAVDRWFMQRGGAAVFSLGQSTTVPAGAGFYNSIVATVTTAAAIGSGDYYDIQQNIEGLNLLDLNWGTANAATVTLSFWVRSSVAGIYSFQLRNSALNRSIVYNYTIATANTWQQITQTIAGDTSGTWLATNGVGIGLVIPLGTGSSYTTATTGTWQAGNFNASTSALTTWQATLSNTFYITGVQLEKGSTATSFDYRPYGTELALCQRYFCKTFPIGTAPGNDITTSGALRGTAVTINASSQIEPAATWKFPVSMRTTPSTITLYAPGTSGHTAGQWTNDGNAGSSANARTNFAGTESTSFDNAGVLVSAGFRPIIHASADAEL